ncbi:hypothetical protein [Tumebacillus permanentifrigoris]|uniref:hypothetical protein n=1 Tax=Tumebacillus permanentifrigoris TaxID=378543 RepID=UPI0011B224B3|nr:hypothetical protein [Tumebacillus permanentifrigoris]
MKQTSEAPIKDTMGWFTTLPIRTKQQAWFHAETLKNQGYRTLVRSTKPDGKGDWIIYYRR